MKWEELRGPNYDNNEGFDDADVADFGGFLCAKYPNLSAAQWQSQFGITAADNLNCSLEHRCQGAYLQLSRLPCEKRLANNTL